MCEKERIALHDRQEKQFLLEGGMSDELKQQFLDTLLPASNTLKLCIQHLFSHSHNLGHIPRQ